jgi:hypothetical protein
MLTSDQYYEITNVKGFDRLDMSEQLHRLCGFHSWWNLLGDDVEVRKAMIVSRGAKRRTRQRLRMPTVSSDRQITTEFVSVRPIACRRGPVGGAGWL